MAKFSEPKGFEDNIPSFDDPTPEVEDSASQGPVLRGFCGFCKSSLTLVEDYGPNDSDSLRGLFAICVGCSARDHIRADQVEGDLLYSSDGFITFAMNKRWACGTDDDLTHSVTVWWGQVIEEGKSQMHALITCFDQVVPVYDETLFRQMKSGRTVGLDIPVTCLDCIAANDD